MTTEPAAAANITEKALRERIHRLFCTNALPAPASATPPQFWVGPTEEQRNTPSLEVEERIVLSDDVAAQAEAQSDEQRWMNSPRIDLGGWSPEAMLTGGEHSRQRLCMLVTAIEVAVRDGSFS
ncbi:MAG: hypothetical protein OXS50_14380 [Gammaproteobacteria bacterium]|nr:hypothetical protein [Gammaproteobacteria bacterium]